MTIYEASELATAQNLAALMEAKSVSIHELSRNTGLSISTIRRLRKKDMVGSIYTWNIIAEYLNVSLGELLGKEAK